MKAIQKIYVREAYTLTLQFLPKIEQKRRMVIFNKTYMKY